VSTPCDEHLIVTRTISRGSDDWAVLLAVDEDGRTIKIVGQGLGHYAEPGRRIRVQGHWHAHPVHGRELMVHTVLPDLRLGDPDPGVEAVLRRVPHLGEKRAHLLVDRYGPDAVLTRIDANPRHVFQKVAGMPLRQAGEASRWWHEHRLEPPARKG
jgi:hypothetical protein